MPLHKLLKEETRRRRRWSKRGRSGKKRYWQDAEEKNGGRRGRMSAKYETREVSAWNVTKLRERLASPVLRNVRLANGRA